MSARKRGRGLTSAPVHPGRRWPRRNFLADFEPDIEAPNPIEQLIERDRRIPSKAGRDAEEALRDVLLRVLAGTALSAGPTAAALLEFGAAIVRGAPPYPDRR